MRNLFRKTFERAAKSVDAVIYPNYRLIERSQIYSTFEQDFLQRIILEFKIDCIFDVGANIGQYAQMLRRNVGYQGNIVSFEAIPACADALRKLARDDKKWTVEEVALSDQAGELDFNVMECTEFSSINQPRYDTFDLKRDGHEVISTLKVRAETLEHFLLSYRNKLGFSRPFLKMDTQGHDIRVAQGAGKHLQDFIGLQSELAMVPIYRDVPLFDEALKFFENSGFALSALVPNNAGHFPYLIETDCIMMNKRFLEQPN